MIRQFTEEDREEVVSMIKDEIRMDQEETAFILDHSDKLLVYEERQRVKGICSLRSWGKDEKNADQYTYVIPSARKQGIADSLMKEVWKETKKHQFQFTSARIETNADESIEFYTKRGYKKWYTELILEYHGTKQPETGLSLIRYEDQYFEQYADGLRTSFYQLRKSNDFKPYYCCELEEQKRKEFMENKNMIYLLMDGQSLIGSVKITSDGFVDDVFVLPGYQGKEYGRKIMQLAINQALKLGYGRIALSAIDWNVRALNLYGSLGFAPIHTIHYYRKFLL